MSDSEKGKIETTELGRCEDGTMLEDQGKKVSDNIVANSVLGV